MENSLRTFNNTYRIKNNKIKNKILNLQMLNSHKKYNEFILILIRKSQ